MAAEDSDVETETPGYVPPIEVSYPNPVAENSSFNAQILNPPSPETVSDGDGDEDGDGSPMGGQGRIITPFDKGRPKPKQRSAARIEARQHRAEGTFVPRSETPTSGSGNKAPSRVAPATVFNDSRTASNIPSKALGRGSYRNFLPSGPLADASSAGVDLAAAKAHPEPEASRQLSSNYLTVSYASSSIHERITQSSVVGATVEQQHSGNQNPASRLMSPGGVMG